MVLDAVRGQHPQTITAHEQDTTEELDSGCPAARDAQESTRTPLTREFWQLLWTAMHFHVGISG